MFISDLMQLLNNEFVFKMNTTLKDFVFHCCIKS